MVYRAFFLWHSEISDTAVSVADGWTHPQSNPYTVCKRRKT